MSAPGWLCAIFAAAMTGVALFHLVRLAGPRALGGRLRPAGEFTHAAAGVAMTLMLLGRLTAWDSRVLIATFAVPTVCFAVRGTRDYIMDGAAGVVASAQLVIGCAAMAYMLRMPARLEPPSGAGGMSMTASAGGPHFGLLGGLLVAATTALALSTARRVRRASPAPVGAGAELDAPRIEVTRALSVTALPSVTSMFTGLERSALRATPIAGGAVAGAVACQLAMNVTTVFMLVAM